MFLCTDGPCKFLGILDPARVNLQYGDLQFRNAAPDAGDRGHRRSGLPFQVLRRTLKSKHTGQQR